MISRRLSAEMRQREQSRTAFAAGLPTPEQYLDALHDLDVADGERDEALAAFAAARDTAIQMEEEQNTAQAELKKLQQLYEDAKVVVTEVIRERDAAQATIAELQSGIDNELCDIRLDGEAKSAEIFRLKAQLAECTEDAIVLSDKLKFAEMDNYAKDSAIDDLSQRIKDQTQKITHQNAVVTALATEIRDIAEESILPDGDGVTTPVALWAESVLERFAHLAADHDAAVRAPLEAQIVALYALLRENYLTGESYAYQCCYCRATATLVCDEDSITHDPTCLMVNTSLRSLATDHDAAVRADERRKVLEEAAQIAADIRERAALPEDAGE